MAIKNPGLLDELTRRMGNEKQQHVDEDSLEPCKHIKIDLSRQGNTSGMAIVDYKVPGNGQDVPMNIYKTEGWRAMEQEANNALVEFLVGCSIPPNVLSGPAFGRFVAAFKTKYSLPS